MNLFQFHSLASRDGKITQKKELWLCRRNDGWAFFSHLNLGETVVE